MANLPKIPTSSQQNRFIPNLNPQNPPCVPPVAQFIDAPTYFSEDSEPSIPTPFSVYADNSSLYPPQQNSLQCPPQIQRATTHLACTPEVFQRIVAQLRAEFPGVKFLSTGTHIEITGEPNNVSAANPRVTSLISETTVKWGWMNDQGEYEHYNAENSRKIESYYQAGIPLCPGVLVNGREYEIILNRIPPHIQRLKNSTICRNIRRMDGSTIPEPTGPSNEYAWEWRNEYSQFIPYSAENSSQIENAFNKNLGIVLLHSGTHTYQVNFSEGYQYNETTGFRREVRRIRKN